MTNNNATRTHELTTADLETVTGAGDGGALWWAAKGLYEGGKFIYDNYKAMNQYSEDHGYYGTPGA